MIFSDIIRIDVNVHSYVYELKSGERLSVEINIREDSYFIFNEEGYFFRTTEPHKNKDTGVWGRIGEEYRLGDKRLVNEKELNLLFDKFIRFVEKDRVKNRRGKEQLRRLEEHECSDAQWDSFK